MIEGSPLATSHNIQYNRNSIKIITWLILITYNQFVNNVDCFGFDNFIILLEPILPSSHIQPWCLLCWDVDREQQTAADRAAAAAAAVLAAYLGTTSNNNINSVFILMNEF